MNNYTTISENAQMFYVSKKNYFDLGENRQKLQSSLGYTLTRTEELGEKLQDGHKISFAIHSRLSERGSILGENWQEQYLFPVDFDNSPISLEETLKLLKPLGEPMFHYKTFSKNSFRIVYHVTEKYRDYLLQTTIGSTEIAREARWERAETFWTALFETIGELTGLSVGASKKEKRDESGKITRKANEFVIDTQVIRQHLATNGTIHEVHYNKKGFITREGSALVLQNVNQKPKTKNEKIATIKNVGEKWNVQQIEARCQQLGVISDMRAWIGAFNSLVLGLNNEFSDISEEEAIQIFMANCDDGNGTDKQYQQMLKRHKPHLANIESFWGKQKEQQLEKVDFSELLWFEKNAITLKENEYVCPDLIFKKINFNKKMLIVAPAGAGKTTSTMKVLEKLVDGFSFERAVFALPTKIAVAQIANDAKKAGFKISNQYGKGEIREFERGEKKILVCTFNKLASEKYDDENTLTIVDEVHLLNDFNSFSTKVMTYMRNITTNPERTVICLTATPHALLPKLFDEIIS
ncbi:MAG: DEAD/DEAH box helicase family protein, partial [Culicoidibacterales bacterium]